MSEVVLLLLPNTDCTTFTKYFSKLNFYQIMSEVVLLLPNTDCLVLLLPNSKLKIMSEVVLLLPNTDWLQQVEDYVRGCTTFTKY